MTAQMMDHMRRIGIAIATGALMLTALAFAVQGASASYEYDAQGRLAAVRYTDGTVVNYTYDDNGNRKTWTRTIVVPDTTPPSAPGTPSFSSITMTSATASWTAATDNKGVTGYDYRVNAGSWQSLSNVLSTNIGGLTAAASYTVSVRARDAAGNIGPASSNSFTTPDTAAPSVPSGLTGSAPNSAVVNLTWNASTDNVGVTGYRVYRGGSQIATSATTSYSDGGRAGTTTYSYQVAAYDAAGNVSGLTSAINVTTPDTIAPTAVSLSAGAASPSQINLTWGGSTDTGGSGLAGYRIFRGGSLLTSTTATNYSDTGLAGSTTYSYTVQAYDNAGNTSAQSNTASATTLPTLTATVNTGVWRWIRNGTRPVKVDPPVTCSGSGGTGSGYTFAWTYISGDTATNVNSPSSPTTIWSRSVPNENNTWSSLWRCRVTDSAGNFADTAVSVMFIRNTIQ